MMTRSFSTVQWLAYFLLAMVLLVYVLTAAAFILVPLVWSIFIAFSIYPLSNWLEGKRIPRAIAIVISLLFVGIFLFGLLYLLTSQMVALAGDFPEIGKSFNERIQKYLVEIQSFIGNDYLLQEMNWSLYRFLSPESLNATLFSTGKTLTLAGIIPLYIFFLLYYKDFFVEFIRRVSAKSNAHILEWAEDAGEVIQNYITGMLKVTLIVALLSAIFLFSIDVEYYLLFAIWIAVMNLIPYIGVFISSAVVIIYVLLTTETIFYPVLTLLVLWGIQLLENNIITPLVVGAKVNVNALAVILAILAGGAIWGVSGMILFIPLTGILKITFDRIPMLQPFGYLLGDNFPVHEKRENFWKIFLRKIKK
ncbi:MAG TPA: AI-2E family transporter [Cyclobacteriaceae bacterium]|nr:AI-2E family transporter [Cyclobacteriaceae bacterium]